MGYDLGALLEFVDVAAPAFASGDGKNLVFVSPFVEDKFHPWRDRLVASDSIEISLAVYSTV